MITYSQWCRIEGNVIPDVDKEYGVGALKHLDKEKIFYGTPEVQLHNPSSVVNGCKFRAVNFADYGYRTIPEIDANWDDILTRLQNENRNAEGALFYYRPVVMTQSCAIIHDDSTKRTLDLTGFVFIDEYATPTVVGITAVYNGSNVPVGEEFDTDDLVITAIYSDGSTAFVQPTGYVVYDGTGQESKVVTEVGSNAFTCAFTVEGKTYQAVFVIPGIKNLNGIRAVYDGPDVAIGQNAQRRFFVVTATYTDGSSATVTDYSFPNGTMVTQQNMGIITVYYKGFQATAKVGSYVVAQSRLTAFYNGPNVEVGDVFDPADVQIRVYYTGSDLANTYFESVDPGMCTFSALKITHEGLNMVTVSFPGQAGLISTEFGVVGFKPEVVLNYILAEYQGSPVYVAKTFSLERILCKAYYSDGKVSVIRDFTINSNIVAAAGDNVFTVTYQGKTAQIHVTGIAQETTTGTSLNLIHIDNEYPEATRRNNRYRGPAEAYKHDMLNHDVYKNLMALSELYARLEECVRCLTELRYDNLQVMSRTLNGITMIDEQIESIEKGLCNEYN